MNLLLTLLLLSIMVIIHELGHFLFAKLFKVKILEFSVGMGPAIFTTGKKKKAEATEEDELTADNNEQSTSEIMLPEEKDEKTIFSVRAFPIGGYVSMAGEDDASDDTNAYCNKPAWQRLIIALAGPVMNILLGIICMFTLVGMESAQNDFLASNTVALFEDYATSDKCEDPLMVGDKIVKIDGVSVHTGNEVLYELMNSGFEPIDIVVIRNGKRLTLKDVVFPTEETQGVAFGNMDFKVARENASFGNIMKHAVFRSFSTIKVITDSIADLFGGRYGADAVSGPIGMAGAVGEATKSGFSSLLYLFTLITMNLGVFNLIPFPALDGGRIVFTLIEMIFRKPIKKEVEQGINTAGIMLLMALMLFITLKDIIGLF